LKKGSLINTLFHKCLFNPNWKTMKQKLNCVLLIDDDEPTTFLSSLFIEEADCAEKIQIADSGEKALNYLKSIEENSSANGELITPDLIFLDINMPAMDGWEFLEKYRQLGNKCKGNVIIIMLTTSLNPDDRMKASQIPEISGFENKPLTPELIDKVLNKYFYNKSIAA